MRSLTARLRCAQRAEQFARALERGAVFLKFGRQGKPKPRLVFARHDTLYWCEAAGKKRAESRSRSLVVDADTGVLAGKKTQVFAQRAAATADEACCFSVVGKSRSLDLCAATAGEAQLWQEAIRALAEAKLRAARV